MKISSFINRAKRECRIYRMPLEFSASCWGTAFASST